MTVLPVKPLKWLYNTKIPPVESDISLHVPVVCDKLKS